MTRVEFRGCRLRGLQAAGTRFTDVGFFDCRLDEANLRMTVWEHAEFVRCEMRDVELYGAALPGARVLDCNLTGGQLEKSNLAGSRLHGSTIDRVSGGESLRDVWIGSDQVPPVALAIFGDLGIKVVDA